MTTPARIGQDDMTRVMKSIAAAKIERARVVVDLENRRNEVIIGESVSVAADGETWDDEDT